jgi:hypothetical protein
MNEIRRVLRTAAWRLFALDLIQTIAIAASVGLVALIILRLVEQVFGLSLGMTRWSQAAAVTATATLLSATLWSIFRRRPRLAVARELDERARLRESLSTALCVERSDDPWARAVVETARDRARRVDIHAALPIRAPRFWPVPPALLLALAVVWWTFPRLDVLGLFEKKQADRQQQRELREVKAEVKMHEDKIEELLRKANVELKPEDKAATENAEQAPRSAEEMRRAAVKKLTSMQDKLGELKTGEKARKMDAMRDALKQLRQPGPGPMENLSRALSQGNFGKAQEELGELAHKLSDGSLSKEQQEQLRQQLEKLGEQLARLAQDQKETEKKLEQAGISKEDAKRLAADPEALKQALEKMQNLSEEQKRQLLEAVKRQAETSGQCNGMSEAMGKMAQGMTAQGMDKQGTEGMEGMAAQLSEMEMMAAEMAALDAAMGECKGMLARLGQGMCEGGGECEGVDMVKPWSAGDSSKRGRGQGGPGQGLGGGATAEEAATSTEKSMAQSKMQQGPIVGSRLVYGEQVKGESVAEFSAAVEAARATAAESVETMQVPREYQDAVKAYFGRLQAKIKATTPAGGGK